MEELTNIKLFDDLTCVALNDESYDFHNDYDCIAIHYYSEKRSLNIMFEPTVKAISPRKNICLTFTDVTLSKMALAFSKTNDAITLNIFYRGKFEQNGQLSEYSSGGEGYYYIEFENGNKLEFFSKSVLLSKI